MACCGVYMPAYMCVFLFASVCRSLYKCRKTFWTGALIGRTCWGKFWSEARRAINTSSVCGDDNHKPQQLNQNLAKAICWGISRWVIKLLKIDSEQDGAFPHHLDWQASMGSVCPLLLRDAKEGCEHKTLELGLEINLQKHCSVAYCLHLRAEMGGGRVKEMEKQRKLSVVGGKSDRKLWWRAANDCTK